MTEENYKYRTGPLFLRDQFKGKGGLQIPVIPKFKIEPGRIQTLTIKLLNGIQITEHRICQIEILTIRWKSIQMEHLNLSFTNIKDTVNEDAYQFKTLSEFKSSMVRGGDESLSGKESITPSVQSGRMIK